jgi:hypothetical protein
MAAGFPVKADYVTGDVLSAANMNDLAGTLNYLDPTAKGDLFPASSGTALTRLAVGANGTVLTADSAEATGLKWASAAGGGGKVLQVVFASSNTSTTVASTTYTDSTLTATITPTSATSTILVIYNQVMNAYRGTVRSGGAIRLLRGATSIQDLLEVSDQVIGGASSVNLTGTYSATYRDSPATTSATTYKTQVKAASTADGGNVTAQAGAAVSTITLLEIGA